MTESAFFIGAPQEFQNICLVYPPTVKDVVANSKFGQYLQVLTISAEDLHDELDAKIEPGQKVPTPLEYLMANCFHHPEVLDIVKGAFLLFTHETVSLFYETKQIIFGDIEKMVAEKQITDAKQLRTLSEENYFEFQNLIRMACGSKPLKPYVDDPTEDPRIKRMKAKARYRDRVKAKKGTANGISLTTCITAVCCMGIGVTPMTIGEMSYVALHELMSMYQEKEKYDIDIRSVLAGANPKKVQPKYWIRNLKE